MKQVTTNEDNLLKLHLLYGENKTVLRTSLFSVLAAGSGLSCYLLVS